MGVFNGLFMLGIGYWFHHSVVQMNLPLPESQKENAFKWFGIGSFTFLGGVILGFIVNWAFVEGVVGGIDVGVGSGFGRTSGGSTGFRAVVLEFFPLVFGLLASYVVRARFILKKELGISKLVQKIRSRWK